MTNWHAIRQRLDAFRRPDIDAQPTEAAIVAAERWCKLLELVRAQCPCRAVADEDGYVLLEWTNVGQYYAVEFDRGGHARTLCLPVERTKCQS